MGRLQKNVKCIVHDMEYRLNCCYSSIFNVNARTFLSQNKVYNMLAY